MFFCVLLELIVKGINFYKEFVMEEKKKTEIIRIVTKKGIVYNGRIFFVTPELLGVKGRLDLEELKFYPISSLECIGFDVSELDIHA